MRVPILAILSLSLWIAATEGRKLANFCYFTNWSNKLASFEARFEIRDINATLCTHLIYAFANIDVNKMKLIPSQNDDDNGQLFNKKGRYFDFSALKVRAPHLKTLLSVGGASAGKGGFLQIVHSRETMRLFSRNCAIYLRDRDFDGIDVDWEYPEDIYRDKFTQLLQIMRDEFDKDAIKVSKPKLLITIAVGVGQDVIDESYNITAISTVVDFISVMTYDFHGPWSSVTSFSGPLFSRASNSKFDQRLSQSWAVDYWIKKGAPGNKIVMGMTGAAVTFTLPNMTNTGVGAPVQSAGKAGPYLQRDGHVTYYRVCEMIRHSAVYKWDTEQKMGYAVLEDQWVGYGNEKSMREKVKYAYDRGLAGTMFWSMDLDDFHGTYCNKGEYPLMTAIYKATLEFAPKIPLTGAVGESTTTPMSTTPVDYQKHHRTNKNGINYFSERNSSSKITSPGKTLQNFCYFTNWSNKMQSIEARFEISDINTTLCSHLIYTFADVDASTMRLVPTQRDDDTMSLSHPSGRYFDFTALKNQAPHLKTLLSVGGDYSGRSKFLQIVRSNDTMRLFSKNSAIFLRDRDFDGINVDLDIPSYPDINRDKFTQLLQIMREEFTTDAETTNKPVLLISIAVRVGKQIIDESYDIPAISSVADYINVQTYDFNGPWNSKTEVSSPLYPGESDRGMDRELTVSWTIDYWIKMGAPASKIVMGMTGAAVTFTLPNLTDTGIGAPVQSPGMPGPYLKRDGHMIYYRVCEMLKQGARTYFDNDEKAAYAVLGDQWIGYETTETIREKIKFAYERGLVGTAFWSMDLDDFNGNHCNNGKFPLMTAIYTATHELHQGGNMEPIIVG